MKAIITKNKDGMIVIDENGNQIQVSQNLVTRKKILFHYNEKFFNKFFNKYAPRIKGLSYQQINFILRKFWSEGTIGCFLRSDWKVIKDNTFYKNHPEEEIVFAPWVMYDRYNIYDYPIALTFINTRAVSFIPTTSFTIDENAVIGYIQRNKKSVFSSIEVKIAQLVDIEMTIRTNLKTQKYPWVIGVSPEDKEKLKNLFSQMEEDNPYIVAGFDDLKNSKAIVSGAPYTLDKLYQLKQAIENEILTILGVNNIGMLETKYGITVFNIWEPVNICYNINIILKKMEILAKRFGVKVFCIDNLMVIEEDLVDEYKMQTSIVKKLKNFAKKYNCIVHLVAHPRKSQNADVNKDDVAGSANITNLADYVTSIERKFNEDGTDDITKLSILKNRHTGKNVSIELKYDDVRHRFYSSSMMEELNVNYLDDRFQQINIDDSDLPF